MMLSRVHRAKRRALKTRIIIKKSHKVRLCIHRSLKHFYAQLIQTQEKGDITLASISTLDREFRKTHSSANNVQTTTQLGTLLAQKALALNIKQVAFDRSGYRYKQGHGRLAAFANAAREAGLEF